MWNRSKHTSVLYKIHTTHSMKLWNWKWKTQKATDWELVILLVVWVWNTPCFAWQSRSRLAAMQPSHFFFHRWFVSQICGHKVKNITPSITWRRESYRKRKSWTSSLRGRETESERAIVNQTNIGTVSNHQTQSQHWGNRVRASWGVECIIWAFPST